MNIAAGRGNGSDISSVPVKGGDNIVTRREVIFAALVNCGYESSVLNDLSKQVPEKLALILECFSESLLEQLSDVAVFKVDRRHDRLPVSQAVPTRAPKRGSPVYPLSGRGIGAGEATDQPFRAKRDHSGEGESLIPACGGRAEPSGR